MATAEMDLSEDLIQSQLVATVVRGDDAGNNASSDDSSFAALKRGLVAADITEDDAEMLIGMCLRGVEAAKQNGVAVRLPSKENRW
jgi:hypothetical protein